MSESAPQDATFAFIHAHGLGMDPQGLHELLEAAITRLERTLYRFDPRRDLPASEAMALERAGFDLDPRDLGDRDPLARATAEYAALLSKALSTSEAATRLGVDTSRIRQRLTADPPTLYGIRLDAGWRIPEFQFEGGALLPGMAGVVAALQPDLHPVAFLRWFVSPNPDLDSRGLVEGPLSPRDWLRLGLAPDRVAELAADL